MNSKLSKVMNSVAINLKQAGKVANNAMTELAKAHDNYVYGDENISDRDRLERKALRWAGLASRRDKTDIDLTHMSNTRLSEISRSKGYEMLWLGRVMGQGVLPAVPLIIAFSSASAGAIGTAAVATVAAVAIFKLFDSMINEEVSTVRRELIGAKSKMTKSKPKTVSA